jgi:hypothetical protein
MYYTYDTAEPEMTIEYSNSKFITLILGVYQTFLWIIEQN